MKSNKFFFWLKTVLFCALMLFCCVIGFIMPLRPEVSDLESRKLAEFPEFSVEDFLSGKYTSSINLWYSDTFPGRDWLIECNGEIKNLYGIKSTAFEGGNVDKDEINTNETFIWDQPSLEPDTTETSDGPDESFVESKTETDTHLEDETDGSDTEIETDTITEIGVTSDIEPDTETETEAVTTEAAPESDRNGGNNDKNDNAGAEVINGFFVSGDRGYQLYYFNKDCADRYARAIMNAAIALKDKANVHSMIAPVSSVIYLTEKEQEEIGVSDGKQGIEYIYRAIGSYSEQLINMEQISSPVKTYNLYDLLNSHRDEYIFYRTDHHWTGLGAYYASRYFLDEMGKSYPALDEYKVIQIDDFLGTLYKHTQNSSLKNNPDTVYAYESPTVKNCKILYKDSTKYVEKPIISSEIKSSNKYLCFITGDRPHTIIHNETVSDGSSILIIKDSFGNAFAPMVADSYEYVHVIDYRHWDGDFVKFVEENSIDDVLFLHNIMTTISESSVETLENFIK